MVYNSFCQERCLHPPPGQWFGNYFDRLPHKNNVFLARHGKALEWPSLPQSPRPWRCQRTWNKPIARRCRQMRTWGRTSWWTMVNHGEPIHEKRSWSHNWMQPQQGFIRCQGLIYCISACILSCHFTVVIWSKISWVMMIHDKIVTEWEK